MSDFSSKVGIVTGGASGIGRATAIAFGREGASVVIADVPSSQHKAEDVVREIEAAGGRGLFVPVDVSRADDVSRLVETTVATFGSLDFAFNNAGIASNAFLADYEEADFDRVIAIDLKGIWLCMKYELKYMTANKGGVIVNAASEAGLVGTPLSAPYVAAKHGVIGLTKVAAGEYANRNIRVNAVAPGAIATPMVVALPSEAQKMLIAPQPLHRFGTPEEVADAVLFLCSERSSFITGTVLAIDGGATSNAQSYDPALSPSS